MPILARFLPSESALLDLSLALADPQQAPAALRFILVRRILFIIVMALPGFFAGALLQLVQLHFYLHLQIPLFFWIREPVMLLITIWLAYEVFYVERFYERFGL
jgi:hypothetical protein